MYWSSTVMAGLLTAMKSQRGNRKGLITKVVNKFKSHFSVHLPYSLLFFNKAENLVSMPYCIHFMHFKFVFIAGVFIGIVSLDSCSSFVSRLQKEVQKVYYFSIVGKNLKNLKLLWKIHEGRFHEGRFHYAATPDLKMIQTIPPVREVSMLMYLWFVEDQERTGPEDLPRKPFPSAQQSSLLSCTDNSTNSPSSLGINSSFQADFQSTHFCPHWQLAFRKKCF